MAAMSSAMLTRSELHFGGVSLFEQRRGRNKCRLACWVFKTNTRIAIIFRLQLSTGWTFEVTIRFGWMWRNDIYRWRRQLVMTSRPFTFAVFYWHVYEMWWRKVKSVMCESEEREVWKWRAWSVKVKNVKCECEEREVWKWREWSMNVKSVMFESEEREVWMWRAWSVKVKNVKCECEEREVWKWRAWSMNVNSVKCESEEREDWFWRAWSLKEKSVKCDGEEREVWMFNVYCSLYKCGVWQTDRLLVCVITVGTDYDVGWTDSSSNPGCRRFWHLNAGPMAHPASI